MGETRNMNRIICGKSAGRLEGRCKGNIIMDLHAMMLKHEIGCRM